MIKKALAIYQANPGDARELQDGNLIAKDHSALGTILEIRGHGVEVFVDGYEVRSAAIFCLEGAYHFNVTFNTLGLTSVIGHPQGYPTRKAAKRAAATALKVLIADQVTP